MAKRETLKVKIEFDGWHCLSKKQKKFILGKARESFINANFANHQGLLIEHNVEAEVLMFPVMVMERLGDIFGNWDGYKITKVSVKTLLNFADRKRKLKLDYFKRLIKENDLQEVKVLLAGNLYLTTDDVVEILMNIQREMNNTFRQMSEEELDYSYRLLLMYAAQKERSLN